MRIELVFIPVIFALAVAVLMYVRPVEMHKTDLSALFIYWPEAYRYAERGDPTRHLPAGRRGYMRRVGGAQCATWLGI
jgi:hypothetical protein